MTVLDAIQANPVFTYTSVNHIKSVLVSRSIDGAANYSESSLKEVELVTADLYFAMTLVPDFKEGQLALKYNPALLKERAKSLYKKHDDPRAIELEPNIINVGISVEDV